MDVPGFQPGIDQEYGGIIRHGAKLLYAYCEATVPRNSDIAAERGYVDDVIDPAETRRKVIAGFELLRTKREDLPRRKHGVIPL